MPDDAEADIREPTDTDVSIRPAGSGVSVAGGILTP
jgi:hypothetical protein